MIPIHIPIQKMPVFGKKASIYPTKKAETIVITITFLRVASGIPLTMMVED